MFDPVRNPKDRFSRDTAHDFFAGDSLEENAAVDQWLEYRVCNLDRCVSTQDRHVVCKVSLFNWVLIANSEPDEPRREKRCLWGFRPGVTQTRLCSHT